jgi:hypothetical protein
MQLPENLRRRPTISRRRRRRKPRKSRRARVPGRKPPRKPSVMEKAEISLIMFSFPILFLSYLL